MARRNAMPQGPSLKVRNVNNAAPVRVRRQPVVRPAAMGRDASSQVR